MKDSHTDTLSIIYKNEYIINIKMATREKKKKESKSSKTISREQM